MNAGVTIYCLAACLLLAPAAWAHPVTKDTHDRTIVVRVQKKDAPNQLRVRIEYRLEVDEDTVVVRDMAEFIDEVNVADYFPLRLLEFYGHFTRLYAPIYAERLNVSINKNPKFLAWRCVSRKSQLWDENGELLKHLRCDFAFEADVEINPAKTTHLAFHDQTYLQEKGFLVVSLVNESGLAIESTTEPNAELYKKPLEQLTLSEEDRQRRITLVLAASSVPAPPVAETPPPPPEIERESHEDPFSLLRLILHGDYGFWLTLLLAFVFGAAHALTPGHGKTLVAAYLIGERGTVWHALFLGLVTTLTHTGIVIILAIIMTCLPHDAQRTFQTWIQNGIGLALGLMVACMGFWLLLQRLAGKADHFHVGGGHHHHGHPVAVTADAPARTLSWWGIVMLGVTGGIVPCWDAIVLLFYTVGTSKFWLVLPAVLAFSAGLAGVLVLIGILVVQVPHIVKARGGDGRLIRVLPTVSAIAVIAVGLWLCYEWSQGR